MGIVIPVWAPGTADTSASDAPSLVVLDAPVGGLPGVSCSDEGAGPDEVVGCRDDPVLLGVQ